MQILIGLRRPPEALAFSADGRYLAAAEARALRVWDFSAGARPVWFAENPHTNPRTFCFTADGRWLLRRFNDTTFLRHDARTGATETDRALTALNPFLFSADGRFAAGWGGRTDGGVQVWCARADGTGGWARAWEREFALDADTGAGGYELLEVSPDSARLARVFRIGAYQTLTERGVEVLDLASGEPLGLWTGELPGRVQGGAVSPSGAAVVLNAGSFYAVRALAPGTEPVKRRNTSARHFTAAAFSPDGTRLVTTSNDTAATVWDTLTWEVRKRYEWSVGQLRAACFAPDGLRCAAGGDAGQIVVWDLD